MLATYYSWSPDLHLPPSSTVSVTADHQLHLQLHRYYHVHSYTTTTTSTTTLLSDELLRHHFLLHMPSMPTPLCPSNCFDVVMPNARHDANTWTPKEECTPTSGVHAKEGFVRESRETGRRMRRFESHKFWLCKKRMHWHTKLWNCYNQHGSCKSTKAVIGMVQPLFWDLWYICSLCEIKTFNARDCEWISWLLFWKLLSSRNWGYNIPSLASLWGITIIEETLMSLVFKRRMHPDDFLDWPHAIDKVFDYFEVSEEKKVKLIAVKFRKYASLWCENLK